MIRSVVAASTANGEKTSAPKPPNTRPANKEAAHKRLARAAKKAIPGRKSISYRLPFLSCRCAVIVGADNSRVGGHWTQPRAVLVGIRLRPWPGFQYPGVLS